MNKFYLLVACLGISFSVYADSFNMQYEELLKQEPSEEVHLELMRLLGLTYKNKKSIKRSYDAREKNIAILLNLYPLSYGTLKNIHLTPQDKILLREDSLSYEHYKKLITQVLKQVNNCLENREYKTALALLSPFSPDVNQEILRVLICEIEHTPLEQQFDLLQYAHFMIEELQREVEQMGRELTDCKKEIDQLNELQEHVNQYRKKAIDFDNIENALMQSGQLVEQNVPDTFTQLKSQYIAASLTQDNLIKKIDLAFQCIKLYLLTGNQEAYDFAFSKEREIRSFIESKQIIQKEILDLLVEFQKELDIK